MTVKEMREKRAEIVKEIRSLADTFNEPDHEATAEENEKWERLNKECDELKRRIDVQERTASLESEMSQSVGDPAVGRADTDGRKTRQGPPDADSRSDASAAPTEEDRCLSFQAWMRSQSGEDINERQEEACRRTGLNPNRRNLDLNLRASTGFGDRAALYRSVHPTLVEERMGALERRDLSAVTGSTGGFTVPEGFVNRLELNMLAFGGMLQVADIMRTESGNDLPWPTADDTTNTGVQLSESTSIGSSVDPSIGQLVFKAYKFSSKLILVPVELLEDSAFNIAAVIGQMLGERLGRISNTKFTTGTGAATPRGLLTASTLGVTAASATAIAADEILDLLHSIDPAYRIGARFMMHDSILLSVRKLKDANGQYLWSDGLKGGTPDTLAGFPVSINQDMQSSVVTATKTIVFGQLNKYKVRQVRSIRLRRLVERYADTDQEGFVAFLRQDGNLLDAGTAPVKHLLQA